MRARVRVVAMAAIIGLGAAACGGGGDDGGGRARASSAPRPGREGRSRPGGSIDWTKCGQGVQCAEIEVPLDYARPRGQQITLALARHAARGARISSLLVNPGGPGAPGLDLAKDATSIFPSEILDHFDVVSWDPRGVGESTAIDCTDDLDRFWAADRSPDDATEVAEVETVSRMLARDCKRHSGRLLAHVASRDTVADMERIREDLGDEKVSYLGFSYGTYLGALYADAHPTRVRAMVLDGAVDPESSAADVTRLQATGFEAALQAFFSDCAARQSCAFRAGGDPRSGYDRLMAQIDAEPLPARTGGEIRELGPGEADIAVAAALYRGREGWQDLGRALAEAARGDGSLLLALSDSYTGRQAQGRYDNMAEAFFATQCLDAPPAASVEEMPALAERMARVAPHLGATTAWLGLPCAYWPVPPVPAPGGIRAAGAPPILALGTTNDPATPLASAEALARQLDSGALAVLEGEGHTAFARGNDCIDGLVVAYLVDLTVPEDGARCNG